MCTVYQAYWDGRICIIKPDGSMQDYVKPSEFEWESQVPAFCAGLAASSSLLSVEASNCGMGTAGAKALGDVLRVNKTLQHLNVSNNSFGKVQVGDQVKLKSSGEMCTVHQIHWWNDMSCITKPDGSTEDDVNASEYEWESQMPAFCAGLAASSSLLSADVTSNDLDDASKASLQKSKQLTSLKL